MYFVLKFDAAEDVPGGVQEGIEELKLQADGRAELTEKVAFEGVELLFLAGGDEDFVAGETASALLRFQSNMSGPRLCTAKCRRILEIREIKVLGWL